MKEEQNRDHLNDEEIEEIEATIVTGDGSKPEVTEKEFARFIGDNADKYLPKFRKFNIDGDDNFVATWHWPSFFFGFIWMAYRRMYLWALVALFFEGFIRYLNIATIQHPIAIEAFIRIIYAINGNYLYYRYAKKKILEVKRQKAVFALEKEGGVNRWVEFIATKELFCSGKKTETESRTRDFGKYTL